MERKARPGPLLDMSPVEAWGIIQNYQEFVFKYNNFVLEFPMKRQIFFF